MAQKELAEFLNATSQAVSKWERNKSYPDLDT
ncbi:helix-turn-helix domain-containing protein [Candidatus Enterococcus ikei]|nr:helix-turn-helix transcriptional regulator [Enterococcus sp. DIV0869a]